MVKHVLKAKCKKDFNFPAASAAPDESLSPNNSSPQPPPPCENNNPCINGGDGDDNNDIEYCRNLPQDYQGASQELPLQAAGGLPGRHSSELWTVEPPKDVIHVNEVKWGVNPRTGMSIQPKLKEPEPCGCCPDYSQIRQQHSDMISNSNNNTMANKQTNTKPLQILQPPPCCVDMSCVLFACQEECPRLCSASPYCRNRRISNREWKQVQVFDAGPKGRGLRTLEDIQQGEFVVEYVGLAVKKRDLDFLFNKYQDEKMLYIMGLDDDIYIDARRYGGVARYINHSCEPNCLVNRWKVNGVSRAAIFSSKFIPAGTELTFDYQWDPKRGRTPTKCFCLSPNCRGTLESNKEIEEEDDEIAELNNILHNGHWKTPSEEEKENGSLVVGKFVKVFFFGNQEWFLAKVLEYRASDKQFLLLWHPIEEDDQSWEDLTKDEWMVLDDTRTNSFVIKRKTNKERQMPTTSTTSSSYELSADSTEDEKLLSNGVPGGGDGGRNRSRYASAAVWDVEDGTGKGAGGPPSIVSEQTGSGGLQLPPSSASGGSGNSLTYIVDGAVKDWLTQRKIIPRAECAFRVNITTTRCARDEGDGSSTASHSMNGSLSAAAEASEQLWKVTVVGLELEKADSYLKKNICNATEQCKARLDNNTVIGDGELPFSSSLPLPSSTTETYTTVMTIPRKTDSAASTKDLITSIQARNRTVNIYPTTNSNSCIDVYTLSGPSRDDVETSLSYVWDNLSPERAVDEALSRGSSSNKTTGFTRSTATSVQTIKKTKTIAPQGFTVDAPETLSILAGTLDVGATFDLLFQGLGSRKDNSSSEVDSFLDDGQWKHSPFVGAFQQSQRCLLWLQSKHIVDPSQFVEGYEAVMTKKVYDIFVAGVRPSQIRTVWLLLEERLSDIRQGVQFIFEKDKVGLLRNILKGNLPLRPSSDHRSSYSSLSANEYIKFADYVQKVCDVSVWVDSSITKGWIILDGRQQRLNANMSNGAMTRRQILDKNTNLARQLLEVGCFVLRSTLAIEESWLLGRQWERLLMNYQKMTVSSEDEGQLHDDSQTTSAPSSSLRGDTAGENQNNLMHEVIYKPLCREIADLALCLQLPSNVAAHACVILYRYVFLVSTMDLNELMGDESINGAAAKKISEFKPREMSLATLYIANKCQKSVKFKTVDELLSQSTKLFYQGVGGADQASLSGISTNSMDEHRVLLAEQHVLETLGYDVFWSGMEWILPKASKLHNAIPLPLLENVLPYCQSGPILAAGPQLWLQYSPITIFVAIAGLVLSTDITNLMKAFFLEPSDVSSAASLIAKALQEDTNKGGSTSSSSKKRKRVRYKSSIDSGTKSTMIQNLALLVDQCNSSRTVQETSPSHYYSNQDRIGCCLKQVDSTMVFKYILPNLRRIENESNCRIHLDVGSTAEEGGSAFFQSNKAKTTCDIFLDGNWRAVVAAERAIIAICDQGEGSLFRSLNFSSAMGDYDTLSSLANLKKGRLTLLQHLDVELFSETKLQQLVDIRPNNTSTNRTSSSGPGGRTTSSSRSNAGTTFCTMDGTHLLSTRLDRLLSCPLKSSTGCISDSFVGLTNFSNDTDPRQSSSWISQIYQSLFDATAAASNNNNSNLSTSSSSSRSNDFYRFSSDDNNFKCQVVAKRWPSEKAQRREDERNSSSKNRNLGFSPSALQEMQLLYQLHSQPLSLKLYGPTEANFSTFSKQSYNISNSGHPNIVLPLAIGRPCSSLLKTPPSNILSSSNNGITAILGEASHVGRTAIDTASSNFLSNEHLYFISDARTTTTTTTADTNCSSSMISLQDVLTRRKRNVVSLNCAPCTKDDILTPKLVASWFHDLLSIAETCHENHVILRMIKPDQISIGPEGVARLLELGGATVLPPEQRTTSSSSVPANSSSYKFPSKNDLYRRDNENKGHVEYGSGGGVPLMEEFMTMVYDPYQAPELVLGSTLETPCSDMWSIGAIMAAMLLGKPLFLVGKDRVEFCAAMFKVIGSPSPTNFIQAKQSYVYEKTKTILKRTYKPGVDRALKFILNHPPEIERQYAGAIDLLNSILKLDPLERFTASQALDHPWMKQHRASIYDERSDYGRSFAEEWNRAQSRLLGGGHNNTAKQQPQRPGVSSSSSRPRSPHRPNSATIVTAPSTNYTVTPQSTSRSDIKVSWVDNNITGSSRRDPPQAGSVQDRSSRDRVGDRRAREEQHNSEGRLHHGDMNDYERRRPDSSSSSSKRVRLQDYPSSYH